MTNGRKYLAWSALGALATANATKAFARSGPASIPSFSSGIVTSELPLHTLGFQAGVTALALAKGAHRTSAGRLGLALNAASWVGLKRIHERSKQAADVIDQALADELGADYRSRQAPPLLYPRSGVSRHLAPSPRWRREYVVDGHISYGPHGRRNTLDVWRRPDLPTDAKAPVLLQIHGGGWVIGDKENQAYPLMSHMAERGWVCVSATYRLSPRSTWPDHIVDVKAALAWVRANIAGHGGDPDWIAITGGSAGGHLCSLAALTPNLADFQPGFEDVDTSVRAAVPFYGVYDWTNRDGSSRDDMLGFLERSVVKATRADAGHLFEQASPMSHVGPHAPPMFFLHGTEDSLVPVEQARAMAEMLRKESQKPVVYAELPGAQHAFEIFSSIRAMAAVQAVERFLDVIRAEDPPQSQT